MLINAASPSEAPICVNNVSSFSGLDLEMTFRWSASEMKSQFLKSMIPHHAGAILMCEEASIQDPEIRVLCQNIIVSQQSEINQMKAILNRTE